MHSTQTAFALLVLAAALPASADQLINDNLIVDGKLCAGSDCINFEPFFTENFKIKAGIPDLLFEDTSANAADWYIDINGGGSDFFEIENLETGATPFHIAGGAPSSSLFVSSNGWIGLGTGLPSNDLHIMDGSNPTVRLEQDGSGGLSYPAATWDLVASGYNFSLRDGDLGTYPFLVENNTPSHAFRITSNGDIGIGTAVPEGKLHTAGDGVQLAYFESTDDSAVQIRMRSDSENRRFLATDGDGHVMSQIVFLDNAVRIAGATDAGANLWLTIDANGITTQGPDCNAPCDLTFDPEAFDVPSIEDHAAFMWENKHLKAVGPTGSEKPLNLTQKVGGMLHHLELAHIYIEELHDRLKSQDDRVAALVEQKALITSQAALIEALAAQNADLASRLEKLETAIN